MKGIVKKLILFLLLVGVLVGIVFLFLKVIFPAPKLDLAYNRAYDYSLNEDEQYIQENLQELYQAIFKAEPTNANLTTIQKYEKFMIAYDAINKNMLSGLLYNQRGDEYNELAKDLDEKYETMITEISQAKAYMKDTFFAYTQSNPSYKMNDLRVYVTTVMRNLDEAVQSQYNFYNTLMAIYKDSSKPSLQNNKAVIINVEICDKMFDELFTNDTYGVVEYLKLNVQCAKNFEDTTFVEANKIAEIYEIIDLDEMIKKYLNSEIELYLSTKTQAHRDFASVMFGV